MRTERQAAPLARGGGTVSGGGKPADRGQSTTPARRPQGPAHGRMVGDCWQKTVCASKHLLRVPKGWAMDAADLDAAQAVGARLVHLHDLETLRHYWATPATIRARGFVLERGAGRQIALPLEHWRATRAEAAAVAEPERGAPGVKQLALWGETR